jgi:hypothetical protein
MTALAQSPATANIPRQPAEDSTWLVRNRVQFDLPPRAMERLSALKRETAAVSYAEVVKNALRLYEALIEGTESGKQFLVRDAAGAISHYRLFL